MQHESVDKLIRRYRQQQLRLKTKLKAANAIIAKHENSKEFKTWRSSEEWIVRVLLCAPRTSARSLADAFHLAAGSDSNLISRPSIGNIRNAWVDMYKKHCPLERP